jgi:hypothetical protein
VGKVAALIDLAWSSAEATIARCSERYIYTRYLEIPASSREQEFCTSPPPDPTVHCQFPSSLFHCQRSFTMASQYSNPAYGQQQYATQAPQGYAQGTQQPGYYQQLQQQYPPNRQFTQQPAMPYSQQSQPPNTQFHQQQQYSQQPQPPNAQFQQQPTMQYSPQQQPQDTSTNAPATATEKKKKEKEQHGCCFWCDWCIKNDLTRCCCICCP